MSKSKTIPDPVQLPLFEIWKPIPGYESLYEVSNQGRIKRLPGTPKCNTERILTPPYSKTGYRFIFLHKKGTPKSHYVHRLVLCAFVGPLPENHEVNHKNGIHDDNRLENLEYVTRSENMLHRYRILEKPACHGEQHRSAKLTENQVREIRNLIDKTAVRELSRRYNVDERVIRDIRDRRIWKHVK